MIFCCRFSCCSFLVGMVSILFMLASAVALIFTTRMHSSELWAMMSSFNMPALKNSLFYGLLGLTLCTMALAFVGFFAARTKHFLPLSLFAILTLISGIASLVAGGVLLSATLAASRLIDLRCSGDSSLLLSDTLTNKFSPVFD